MIEAQRPFVALAILGFAATLVAQGGGSSAFEQTRARIARIGTAYVAKTVASAVFVAGRDLESLKKAELKLPQVSLLGRVLEIEIDREARLVRASAFGVTNVALHRPGFGCTLLRASSGQQATAHARAKSPPTGKARERAIDALHAQVVGLRSERRASPPWPRYPQGEFPRTLDREALDAAVDAAFAKRRARTRAVVVIHDGRLVAERYAKGFDATTPQRGWSMNKSLLNALIGARLHRAPAAMSRTRGRVNAKGAEPSRQPALPALDAPIALAAWNDAHDPRRAITLRQLLAMSSNLAWNENYADFGSDSIRMLFALRDAGGFAATKKLAGKIGAHWHYSSGTSNLLSRALRESFETHAEYLRFPREALFDPIGMHSAVLELDPSGSFVSSSFGWATPRDWARLGELFRKDGVWNGQRILPEGWVRASVQAVPRSPQGRYGLHWWLNRGHRKDGADRPMPRLPRDVYFASGFEQQILVVVPSKKLVAVRLGCSHHARSWSDARFVESLCAAAKPSTGKE